MRPSFRLAREGSARVATYRMNDEKWEEVISAIQERPQLWMAGHSQHKHRVITKRKWAEVSKIVDMDVPEVKKKWKHLRDQYRKELKKKLTTRSGAASEDTEWIPQWKYYNLMTFLQDEVLPTLNSGNLSNPANLSQDSMSPLSTNDERTTESRQSIDTNFSTCDIAPRRSLSDQRNEMLRLEKEKFESIKARIQDKKEEELKVDEDYMFFMSMLPQFKRLTNIQKLRLRHKLSEMILEMTTENEYGNMFENNTPAAGDYVASQSQPQYFRSGSHNAGGSSSILPCASRRNVKSERDGNESESS